MLDAISWGVGEPSNDWGDETNIFSWVGVSVRLGIGWVSFWYLGFLLFSFVGIKSRTEKGREGRAGLLPARDLSDTGSGFRWVSLCLSSFLTFFLFVIVTIDGLLC